MAFSGTISTTTFNTNRVIDTAFRRCKLPAQAITAEMQQYARDELYLLLSNLANNRVPSWCIEKQVYPLTYGQSVLTLDIGTVSVLNANFRITQPVEPVSEAIDSTSATYDLGSPVAIAVAGVKSDGTASSLTFETSSDGLSWASVGSRLLGVESGVWNWLDASPVVPKRYFRIVGSPTLDFQAISLGTLPQEIPMGRLNRDGYVDQSNKAFTGRPLTYWFQRDLARPVMNLWPSPNEAAELSQVVVTRHRHVMDVGELAQEIEVPQRWFDAITFALAERVGMDTPSVDPSLVATLGARALAATTEAWMGDTDGSPIVINPAIGCYTR